ncbi:MAG: M20/M25/M40 family metallo-hydrolase [Clostridium sp.]|nr:M20/M25/M40 family metallo-hydrolase [Clostridium sp.]
MVDLFKKCEELTKELVKIKSVNTTKGEKEIAEYIEKHVRNITYFKENPDRVIIQKLKNDKLDRRNVFAYVKGTREESNDTIIFHGHMDTVGTEDFGALEKNCVNPDVLLEKMLEMDLPKAIKDDLETGDWMVGRGSCDMKSGVAVFLVLLEYFSERTDEFKGNILLSVNPVEENLHTGIIEGIEVLNKLKEEEHFNYIMAINNDYICPLYEGDTNKYVYTGTVGKLLPCFYIQGKETHVGQCFEGFDASVLASEITRLINYNVDFCDGYNGEYTLPPSVLKMKDLKSQYNVQTTVDSFVYFNYFVHNNSIEEIMKKLVNVSNKAVNNVINTINENYKKYCELAKIEYKEIGYDVKVVSYEEIFELADKCFDGDLEKEIEEYTLKLIEAGTDKRETSMLIAKKLVEISKIKDPMVVIFFAPPYCPHNTLKKEVEEEDKLTKDIRILLDEFEKESGENYEVLQFFPSLSDSSYIKIDDDNESIDKLIRNFPQYKNLYNVPLYAIKELNISAINYGCYGKDAHKWSERVYKPYSFGVLPKLIIKTIEKFM